jgi:hypothetical protein
MSNFTIDTDFKPGDEIKIVFDISNEVPTTTDKTVYIVDLQEGTPHSVAEENITSGDYQTIKSENIHWSNVRGSYGETNENYYAGASSSDGAYNTTQIINQTNHVSSAAKIASDISRTVDGVTYNDWYLPTVYELGVLYNLMSVLDPIIANNGGSKLRKNHVWAIVKNYWASLEASYLQIRTPVFSMSFNPNSGGGAQFGREKHHNFRVRAVRSQTTTDNVSVGDIFGGGIIYKIVDSDTATTAQADLDITLGYADTNILSQNNLASGYSNSGVELTITSAHGSNPKISFNYSNSNTGNYTWQTNVRVFKKVEEIAEVIKTGSRTTIAWSEAAQRWVSRYSFTPEYFSTHKTTFASFVKGQLYIHDDSNNKNYFYNGKYPTQISYVENVQPSQPKVFMTHSVEGNASPTISRFETVDNWTMNSDLNTNDYVRKEGTYYSEMFGDTNDPNVGENSTYGDRLMRGTKLRGQYIKVFMAFRQEDLEVKHSNIGFITSKGHTT